MPTNHFFERVEIKDEWLDEFPFLGLALGPASLVGPVAKVWPKTLRVPEFHICTASLGNLTAAYPHVTSADGGDMERVSLNISGCDRDLKMACVKAVAEAAERYSSVVFHNAEVLTATADELGTEAVDWHRLPKGSSYEYQRPDAICRRFGPNDRIGWIPGISLLSGERKYVPLALVFLDRSDESSRHWLPISTGMAAHTDIKAAMVSAICEVIERDAIALTWLLRLPLPRLAVEDAATLAVSESLDTVSRSGVRHLLFDATTDIGVPTVYAVQLRDNNPLLANLVSCATSFDECEAIDKTARECAAVALSFEQERYVPDDPDLFTRLEDGAAYMSHPARRQAFSFLMRSTETVSAPRYPCPPESNCERLARLQDIFRNLDMEVVVVDMTPDDVRAAGLVVVRALIPDLMPMSCVTRFRYLGHRRLHDYAARFGMDASCPENINPFPQPFA